MNLLRFLVKSDLRIFGFVFVAIVLVSVIHTVRQPLMYAASGTVKFHSYDDETSHHSGAGMGDWNEMRVALKSSELIQRLIGRFSEAERTGFLAAYARPQEQSEGAMIEHLIRENQRVSFDRLERALTLQYQHPDRQVAARIVNLLVDKMIAYQARKRIDESMKEVEELKLRAEAQDRHVRELTEEITAYRERSEKNTGKSFEVDADYEAMQQRLAKEQKRLDTVIHRMRDMTMISGPVTLYWNPSKRAVPPNENDYLIAPIAVRLSWGFVVAVVGGLIGVAMRAVFSRGGESAHNQKEAA